MLTFWFFSIHVFNFNRVRTFSANNNIKLKKYGMKKFIFLFAILTSMVMGFSQSPEKGQTQLSALSVTSSGDASVLSLISSPSVTYYISDGVGISLGVENLESVNIGARYYVKENYFAGVSYDTGSSTVDLGLGKTLIWGEHANIEPRLTLSDVANDSRDLGLSIHLNLLF